MAATQAAAAPIMRFYNSNGSMPVSAAREAVCAAALAAAEAAVAVTTSQATRTAMQHALEA